MEIVRKASITTLSNSGVQSEQWLSVALPGEFVLASGNHHQGYCGARSGQSTAPTCCF